MLELGARGARVDPRLRGYRSYVGVDVHAGPNVDVVGDAHRLSQLVDGPFDALYSISTFEHLAMPWQVVLEINRILRVGGLVFTATHHTWPPHELPWDYWRYSKGAFAALFNEHTGFELLRVEEGLPAIVVSMVDEASTKGIHRDPTPLGVSALARKIGPARADLRWDLVAADVASGDYPKHVARQSSIGRKPTISAVSRVRSRRSKSNLPWVSSGDSASIETTCGGGCAIGQSPATITTVAETTSRPSAGSMPGRSSVTTAPRSETIGLTPDSKMRAASAETFRSSAVRHLTEQIAEERALGERARERPGDDVGHGLARPQLHRHVDLPGLPLPQQQPQVDLLARLEVPQDVRLREPDAACDVAERDVADRTLDGELPRGEQDRLAAFRLVRGSARALVLGRGRGRVSLADRRRIRKRCSVSIGTSVCTSHGPGTTPLAERFRAPPDGKDR